MQRFIHERDIQKHQYYEWFWTVEKLKNTINIIGNALGNYLECHKYNIYFTLLLEHFLVDNYIYFH